MRFRKPFTLSQRQQAIGVYRSMQAVFRIMRTQFRPQNDHQRSLMKQFRQSISDFGAELRPKDAKVNVRRLNAAMERADGAALEYAMARNQFPRSKTGDA
jgi:hypothetical protein